jgi:hypothetical protein
VRNKLSAEYWDMSIRDGDRVFYDVTLDTLVPKKGWVIADDLDALYISPKYHFAIGARYSVVKPIYNDDDFRSAAERMQFEGNLDPTTGTAKTADGKDVNYHGNTHHRLGLLATYTFSERDYARFNKPTLLLITSWYLSHRYRTGQDVSQATPYIILGFAFQSDLLN